MQEFIIEESIEKKPTILGLKSGFFFGQVGALLVGVYLIFVTLNIWVALIVIVALGLLYLFLYLKTNDFNANRSLDKKVPLIIQCNPMNDEDD